jgi:hypothetical protein
VSAWIASVLPTPSRIRVRGSFGPATSFDVSLQDLLDRGRSASRDELAVAALDWVVMSERRAQGSLGAAEPSLRSLAELLRPAGSDATLVLDVARASGWSADALSVDDALQVGAAMRTLLSASRGLLPKDVSFGAVANDAEMTARSSAAQSAATQVLQQLADAGRTSATPQDKKSALLRAGQFGVSISAVDDELDAQLAAAARDLTNRVTAVNDPTLGPGDRLSVLFGRAFPAVPEVVLVTGSLDTALIQAPGATPAAVRTFLSRVGRVRDPVARLNAMLSFVDAVNPDDPGYSLRATQIPLSAGEQWVALPGPVSAGRKGLVAVTAGVLAGDMLTGIIVDEWIEIVPDGYANTSIAIHTNAPSVAAPNALILCVPTPGHEQWTADDLLAGVQDAITLTRLRAVDPDILGDAGQVLPALIARDDWYMRSLMVTLTEPGGAS